MIAEDYRKVQAALMKIFIFPWQVTLPSRGPKEGGVRGVLKPQNRTEIRQKTANRIRIFPEYRNRTYMEAHYMKADINKTCDIF